jgi:hypothetical protein
MSRRNKGTGNREQGTGVAENGGVLQNGGEKKNAKKMKKVL